MKFKHENSVFILVIVSKCVVIKPWSKFVIFAKGVLVSVLTTRAPSLTLPECESVVFF